MRIIKDGDALKAVGGNLNVNEEYLSAFQTKSYIEILTKAQLLTNPSSSSSFCRGSILDFLLEPEQEAISTILETTVLSKKPKIKILIQNYFHISAEASSICSNLLTSINQLHYNYQFIQRVLNTRTRECFSPDQYKYVVSELKSFNVISNPFSNLTQQDFRLIHDRYAAVLHHLKSKQKKIARKIKFIKCFKRPSGVSITVASGVAAIFSLVNVAHSLCGLLMTPAIVSMPLRMKKLMQFQFFRSRLLRTLRTKLDVAAKGAYVLNRDIETISRLVSRLHGDIEHLKEMIQFCLDRKEDRFSLQEVVKEIKKCDIGFKNQVEDLEQHVYLCLVTINRARVLVMNEMTTSYTGTLH